MAKVIDYIGRAVVAASVLLILSTVGAMEHSGMGFSDGVVQMLTLLAVGGIGGFLMMIGGKGHE